MTTYLLTLVLWFPVHTVLHEGMHAATAKAYGGQIESFKPYPHFEEGTFYFGSMSAILPADHKPTFLAPYALDAFMLSGGVIYLANNDIDTEMDKVITSILVIAPLIDITVNICRFIRVGEGDFKVVLGGSF